MMGSEHGEVSVQEVCVVLVRVTFRTRARYGRRTLQGEVYGCTK